MILVPHFLLLRLQLHFDLYFVQLVYIRHYPHSTFVQKSQKMFLQYHQNRCSIANFHLYLFAHLKQCLHSLRLRRHQNHQQKLGLHQLLLHRPLLQLSLIHILSLWLVLKRGKTEDTVVKSILGEMKTEKESTKAVSYTHLFQSPVCPRRTCSAAGDFLFQSVRRFHIATTSLAFC